MSMQCTHHYELSAPQSMDTVDNTWHILSVIEISCNGVEYLWRYRECDALGQNVYIYMYMYYLLQCPDRTA